MLTIIALAILGWIIFTGLLAACPRSKPDCRNDDFHGPG